MKILWTKFALDSLHDIFIYYKENVSKLVAQNIKNSILSCTWQLEKQPLSGSVEKLLINLEEGHRFIIRGNYKIIYKIQNKKIFITDIFDTRQDPESIKRNNDLGVTLNEPIGSFI